MGKYNELLARLDLLAAPRGCYDGVLVSPSSCQDAASAIRELEAALEEAELCDSMTKKAFDQIADRCDQLGILQAQLIQRTEAAESALASALSLLQRVDATGLLFKHSMDLDADVANFLHGQEPASAAPDKYDIPLFLRKQAE